VVTYYRMNFALVHHHKYSLWDIENMYLYERDFYTSLLEEYEKKKAEELSKGR